MCRHSFVSDFSLLLLYIVDNGRLCVYELTSVHNDISRRLFYECIVDNDSIGITLGHCTCTQCNTMYVHTHCLQSGW